MAKERKATRSKEPKKAMFSNELKTTVIDNFDALVEEMNALATRAGIHDARIAGFILEPTDAELNCPCGVQTYIDPRTGKVSKRCKRCP